jgi:hypothetical protein
MPGSGTRTFLEPDHYEASLGHAQIEILIAFKARPKAEVDIVSFVGHRHCRSRWATSVVTITPS